MIPFSQAITGIGIPCLGDCLDTLFRNPLADEVFFACDDTGRFYCEEKSDLLCLTVHDVRQVNLPFAQDWRPCNGIANFAMRVAKHDWVMLSHEDTLWPQFDYADHIRAALLWLSAKGFVVDGKRVVGIEFGMFEARGGAEREQPLFDRAHGLTDWLVAHTAVFSKAAWEEMGGVSETDGIWWNHEAQEEIDRRDWRLLYLRWPAPLHLGARSLAGSGYCKGWTLAKRWEDSDGNFLRKYGKPPRLVPPRTIEECPGSEILL